MKNKKVILLILAILVVLTLVSVLVVRNLKKDEVVVVNNNLNVNENVNQVVETEEIKKELEIVDGVDISDWKTYVNEEYGYSVRYPGDWSMREFLDTKTGASFTNDNNEIIVDISGLSADPNIDFIEYVKLAAINTIESYEELNYIQEFETVSRIKAYKTNWKVRSRDGGIIISNDIIYFEARKNDVFKNIAPIWLSYNSEQNEYSSKIFNIMSKSLKYIN